MGVVNGIDTTLVLGTINGVNISKAGAPGTSIKEINNILGTSIGLGFNAPQNFCLTPYASSLDACTNGPTDPNTGFLYTSPYDGNFYTITHATAGTPFNGGNSWYYYIDKGFSFQIDTLGVPLNQVTC